MDSLTQITLGAAVGEAVLGKKYGNRAMAWGAVAGTIPDLDVLANLFMEEIPALAAHRAITHSLFFAVLWPFVFGYLIHWIYRSGTYLKKGYKWFGFSTSLIFYILFALTVIFILGIIQGRVSFEGIIISIGVGAFLFYRMYKRYVAGDPFKVESNYRDWVWLLFWATITHPLLDCCTAYGTQLWQPFSNYRVAWDNISVADPLYTFPFLTALIIASNKKRGTRSRFWWNWAGIIYSLLYMSFTVVNKQSVNDVFHRTLDENEVVYERCMTAPTILNNVLWHCVAEADSGYYAGFYSLMEDKPVMKKLHYIPKNHEMLKPYDGVRDVETIKWFSKGYYNVMERDDGKLQMNNLRFGSTSDSYDKPEDFMFAFTVERENDGSVKVTGRRERGPNDDNAFKTLWDRILAKDQ